MFNVLRERETEGSRRTGDTACRTEETGKSSRVGCRMTNIPQGQRKMSQGTKSMSNRGHGRMEGDTDGQSGDGEMHRRARMTHFIEIGPGRKEKDMCPWTVMTGMVFLLCPLCIQNVGFVHVPCVTCCVT
jgi:hypothetical protein